MGSFKDSSNWVTSTFTTVTDNINSMDQKVVCMFLLLVVGTSHGLQCYTGQPSPGDRGTEDNFDPANANKVTCDADHDVCIKTIGIGPGSGIDRRCEDLKNYKNFFDPILELDTCSETTISLGPETNRKATVCTCSQDLCNKSTMLNGGMVLVFALMGFFMLHM